MISWIAIRIWVITVAVLLLNCRSLCLGLNTFASGTGFGIRPDWRGSFDLIWLTVFVLAGSRDLKALRIASSSVSGFKTVAPILFWPLGTLPSWAVDPIAVPSSSSLSKKGFPGSGVVAGFDFVSRFTAPSSSMALSTRESCQDPRRFSAIGGIGSSSFSSLRWSPSVSVVKTGPVSPQDLFDDNLLLQDIKAKKVEMIAAFRQLQAISHQISILHEGE